jgi:hypothetical protein
MPDMLSNATGSACAATAFASVPVAEVRLPISSRL